MVLETPWTILYSLCFPYIALYSGVVRSIPFKMVIAYSYWYRCLRPRLHHSWCQHSLSCPPLTNLYNLPLFWVASSNSDSASSVSDQPQGRATRCYPQMISMSYVVPSYSNHWISGYSSRIPWLSAQVTTWSFSRISVISVGDMDLFFFVLYFSRPTL